MELSGLREQRISRKRSTAPSCRRRVKSRRKHQPRERPLRAKSGSPELRESGLSSRQRDSQSRHLTPGRPADNPSKSAMSILRTIIVALTALSVAMLPIAAASAGVSSPKVSVVAPSDCCPPGQHCDKQTKGDCGKSAECTLKCSGVSALHVVPTRVALSPASSPRASTLTGLATTRSSTPPSPPPRV
jgi:hypothetical protein